jgi:hypothetical protein
MNTDPNYDMFNDLQGQGGEVKSPPVSNPQEATVRKLLHPPSAIPGFDGLPTNDARTQVLLQYANTNLNKTPLSFGGTLGGPVTPLSNTELETFDYGILSMNGLRVLSVPFIYRSGTGAFFQDVNNIDIQDAYDAKRFCADAQLYRPAYKSITTQLNATAFNNTGIVTGNQFNPNIMFAGSLLSMAHGQPELLTHFVRSAERRAQSVGRSLIVRRDHPDYGRHLKSFSNFPTYIQDELRKVLSANSDHAVDLDPNTDVQIVNFGQKAPVSGSIQIDPVPSASQLLNQSMRSYTGRAREGTFAVQRLNTVSPDWLTAGNTSHSSAPLQHGLYQCYYFILDGSLAPHVIALTENLPDGATEGEAITKPLLDTIWSKDMTWSWLLYEGLSLNTQTSQPVSTQLIIRKTYTGFEVQPAISSAWAGLTRLAPQPNIATMQATMDGFYQMKDVMPSCYNFWGTIGTILGPSLLKAGGSILSWLTNKVTSETRTGTAPPKRPKPAREAVRAAAPAFTRDDLARELAKLNIVPRRQQLAPRQPLPKGRKRNAGRATHRQIDRAQRIDVANALAGNSSRRPLQRSTSVDGLRARPNNAQLRR